MTFENLKSEFEFTLEEYNQECESNKGYNDKCGHEGTTKSFMMLSRLNLMSYFAKTYFNETLEFERHI